jgi:hypothetical protein
MFYQIRDTGLYYRIYRPVSGPCRGWLWQLSGPALLIDYGDARTWTTARGEALAAAALFLEDRKP